MVSLKQPPRRASARKPISAPEAPPAPIAPLPAVPEPIVAAAPIAPAIDPVMEEERVPRSARVPLGTQRQRLVAPERPGFKRRFFNEVGNRIQAARQAGYTHVKDETTLSPRKELVGTLKEGGGMWAYLMEIPIEYYEEDMREKDRPLRQFDQDIRRGHGPGTAPGDDGRYVPIKPDGSPRIEIKDSTRL